MPRLSHVGIAPALRGGAAIALASFAACALLAGCADDLPKATEITHMRVLGATLEVEGDPSRTTPKPGETVKMTFATVFPSQTETTAKMQTMLIGCTAPNRFTGGLPVCQEFLDLAMGTETQDISSALNMTAGKKYTCDDLPAPRIQMGALSIQCLRGDPTAQMLVDPAFTGPRMLFVGVICERGKAFIDPKDPLIFGCDNDSGETIQVNGLITVQQKPSEANHNPSLEALELVLGPTYFKPWLPFEGTLPPANDCREDAQTDERKVDMLTLPHADPGKHEIAISYEAAAREKIDGEPETTEITIYTTSGEMERRFTLFESDDKGEGGKLVSDIEWKPPKLATLPPKGQLARFYVTVRDQRGGFGITSRAACVY
jgi:hypothetical protein